MLVFHIKYIRYTSTIFQTSIFIMVVDKHRRVGRRTHVWKIIVCKIAGIYGYIFLWSRASYRRQVLMRINVLANGSGPKVAWLWKKDISQDRTVY